MDKTIEARAKNFFGINDANWDVFDKKISEKLQYGYIVGAEQQYVKDHSEEHLMWIVNQYQKWHYEMEHCDNNEQCTFEEWIKNIC